MAPGSPIRWRLADDDGGRPALFEETIECHPGRGEFRGMDFLHVRARRVINEVPKTSPVPFRYTINAYRGCSHACTYCFARPTHEYLGLDAGDDFERRIVVKINAVERVRAELASPRWRSAHIAMGTNTDPYQRCEGKYRLTRGVVSELASAGNPFSILTKSTLILRDLDLLAEAATRTEVRANFSIGTLDEEVWRTSEPGTPHPRKRVEAVAALNAAGVPCGVLIAPVLPGLSDSPAQLEAVVEAVCAAGACSVAPILLHLRPGVREHYLGWLGRERPDLMARHRELYPRAYAPSDVQRQLSRVVARMVRRHGGRCVTPTETRARAKPPISKGCSAPPRSEQLRLGL